jgi:hypothetical protein
MSKHLLHTRIYSSFAAVNEMRPQFFTKVKGTNLQLNPLHLKPDFVSNLIRSLRIKPPSRNPRL